MNSAAEEEPGSAFDDIPASVWGIICHHLSLRDLLSFSAVRRSWHAIASDDALWRDLYAADLPGRGACIRASSVLGFGGGEPRLQPPALDGATTPWRAAVRLNRLTRQNWRRGIHGSRHLKGHAGPVRSVKFEGDLLISADVSESGDFDQHLRVWSLDTGACRASFRGHRGRITAVDLADGLAATAAVDGTLRVWDASGAFAAPRGAWGDEEQGAWEVPGEQQHGAGGGGDGDGGAERAAASADLGGAGEGRGGGAGRRGWEARDAFELACVRVAGGGEAEAVCCLSIDAASGLVAASNPTGRVVCYDSLQRRGGGDSEPEALLPETVLSAGDSGQGSAREHTCVLMRDGICAASLPESRVGLWRVPGGDGASSSASAGATWDTGQLRVNTLSFHAGGGLGGPARVVCGGQDGSLKVYDACSALAGGRGGGAAGAAQPLRSLHEHTAHVLCHQQGAPGSPDLVASGSDDRTARIWDMRQPPQWACVQLLQHQAAVSCLQLSDWVLATGGGNGFISLWDVRAGGVRLATLHGHRGAVWALQLDARRLVSSAVDDSLIVRSFEPDETRFARWRGCAVCGRAGRRLFSCSMCSLQTYCSDECESSDWPAHRLHCPNKPHELIRLQ